MPRSTAHRPIASTSSGGYTAPVGLLGDTNNSAFGRGGDGSRDDRLGRRKVGLARAEADDVLARGLQRLRLGVDRERGRLVDGLDASRDTSHGPNLRAGTSPHPAG